MTEWEMFFIGALLIVIAIAIVAMTIDSSRLNRMERDRNRAAAMRDIERSRQLREENERARRDLGLPG